MGSQSSDFLRDLGNVIEQPAVHNVSEANFGGSADLPKGVVKCGNEDTDGGDVVLDLDPSEESFENSLLIELSARTLEKSHTPQSVPETVLHHIACHDIGRPLWKFSEPEQLVRAMQMAIRGKCDPRAFSNYTLSVEIFDSRSLPTAHQALWSHEILYRDISAGNILMGRVSAERAPHENKMFLKESRMAETEGFLADFGFASLPESWSEVVDETGPRDGITVRCHAALAISMMTY